ncbi:hypothetical protein B0H34DRAFT_665767 [Crassisporium funariophilum]|nr:hypothetical protein B0H34DRAFT_665767 [Crassisporium funariophilum]
MPVRKKTSTTRLPQTLQQQIDQSAGTPQCHSANDHPQNRRRPHLSRKDARKEERASRKQKKADHFSRDANVRKRYAEEEHVDSPQRKKARPLETNAVAEPKTRSSIPHISTATSSTSTPPPVPKVTKKIAKVSTLAKISKKVASPSLRKPQEEKEDAYIAYLESKLSLGKGGKKKTKTVDADDGLDDLMNWADSFVAPTTQAQDDREDGESETEGSIYDSERDSDGNYDSEEEWHGIDTTTKAFSGASGEEDTPVSKVPAPVPGAAYVPPQARNVQRTDDTNSEAILKLTRQLKGLLNRMGEQNISTILDSVEEIYRSHRRNDVTSTLTTLIIDGISAHSSLLDSYVVLHAAFVASLHKIVGVELAAHFVQTLVASFERHYAALQDAASSADTTELDGKECSNLLVLISELYNFQVISSVLVFDVIRSFLNGDFTEFKVELLLKIMRNSGQQLRQDDPSALKDIIQIVQSNATNKDDAMSSRTRFMIETLTNLKNNKLKRNVTQNQGGAAVDRMKKFLSGLSKTRHVLAHEPLRVSLEDLHSAGSKGKWWLVGAAWGGDPLVDKQVEFSKNHTKDQEPIIEDDSGNLIKLARSQGMNTEIRRGIFVVLLSSDDYLDACDRLSQLNLTEIQQREIIRVILHCCGNERSYNPYYTLVCQQLCHTAHAYRITLQFSLWDFLRDLGETNVGGAAVIKNIKEDEGFDVKSISEIRMRNVAKAYAWWLAKDCVTLVILKPVDFTALKPQTREFFKELFTQIFINSQRSTPLVSANLKDLIFTRNRNAIEEIFMKASRVQALAMGLVYFLSEAFQDISIQGDGLSKFLKWSLGVAKETLQTGVDTIPAT